MKRFVLLSVFLCAVFFSYTVVAQEFGSIRKNIEYSFPEKIQKAVLEPLPSGTYTIGTGGYFSTIQSAFDRLSTDGIAGEVILELTDNLYTAPTDSFGFKLNGPISGAGPISRVIIKPAASTTVTLEGNGFRVMTFINTSYLTLDGVGLSGSTTLTFHALYNASYTWNDCVNLLYNSDHNIVKNINFISEDFYRYGASLWILSSSTAAPDSNLILNNFIKKGGAPYIGSDFVSSRPVGNVIRGNIIGSETDSLINWGIQVSTCKNSIIENNIIQNLKIMNIVGEQLILGINSYSGLGDIIRNNVVHNIKASSGYTGVGILLSGGSGSNNLVYNNMVYDIQSTSIQFNSRVAGIQIWNQVNPKIYYNSVYLSGNGANPAGSAALYIYGGFSGSTSVDLKNNIFINTRNESTYISSAIYDYTASNLTSDYNDFYSANNLVRIGGTNYNTLADWQATGKDLNSVNEMPNFVDPYLHINSNMLTQINGGANPSTEITTDFDGDLRNQLNPDIGADEFLVLHDTLYVPQEYVTIQAAINAAVDENLVLVDEGTYVENINFKGKAITVASKFYLDGDEAHIANTVINGSQPLDPDSASVVTFKSGEDTNSVICGFTITGGSGTVFFQDAIVKRLGGGIFVHYSDATIKNNIIELNDIQHDRDAFGGGISAISHNANNYIIENNIIRNNSINTPSVVYYSLGAGIYTGTIGKVRIVNNSIVENTITASIAYGGGILPANFGNSSYTIFNNFISGNVINATMGGSGGIDIYTHTPMVRNNVIVNNSAPNGGGLFIEFVKDASGVNTPRGYQVEELNKHRSVLAVPLLENNTIAYNNATASGGGIEIIGVIPEVMNCILWGNTAPTGSQINGDADVSYTDVESGYTGTGNIDMDPLFRDAANDNFHLQSTDCGGSYNSPCIDAGNPAYNDWLLDCDWGLGLVRSDMGAFGGTNSIVDVSEVDIDLPTDYVLFQNYPNPFNPSTIFKYSIPQTSKVVIKVFDILGKEVATLMDEEKSVGTYALTWNAANLPSGVYFYQLKAGSFIETKKMLLLK